MKRKKDKKMSTSRFSLPLAPFACFFTSSIHSLVSIYLYIYIYILSICLSIDINTIRVYYRWPTLVCLRLPQTANRNCVVRLEQKNKTKKRKSREKKSLKKKVKKENKIRSIQNHQGNCVRRIGTSSTHSLSPSGAITFR